jgi:hypothetical protein
MISLVPTPPNLLLERALKGDVAAYRKFLTWVEAFTHAHLTTDDAFIQGVLHAVHEKRHTFQSGVTPEAWLTAIIDHERVAHGHSQEVPDAHDRRAVA